MKNSFLSNDASSACGSAIPLHTAKTSEFTVLFITFVLVILWAHTWSKHNCDIRKQNGIGWGACLRGWTTTGSSPISFVFTSYSLHMHRGSKIRSVNVLSLLIFDCVEATVRQQYSTLNAAVYVCWFALMHPRHSVHRDHLHWNSPEELDWSQVSLSWIYWSHLIFTTKFITGIKTVITAFPCLLALIGL